MIHSSEKQPSSGPLRWGVLSSAKIARNYVVPAMMKARRTEVAGLASRQPDVAAATAKALGIPKGYGSYEALLSDPDIDAIYNPLPNHLHAEWTIKALQAGKHVLCEKPLGLSAPEVNRMRMTAEARPDQLLMEGFMYRYHPQWTFVTDQIRSGRIGQVQLVQGHFSYYNTNKDDIRNIAAFGGGGLLDIGCYCVSAARWIFGQEPEQVIGHEIHHPETGVDTLSSGIMHFGNGIATFSCGTALNAWQGIVIGGTDGRIEINVPFNPPADQPARVHVHAGGTHEVHETMPANQFMLQAEAFAACVLDGAAPALPLEESAANMFTLDELRRSARERCWISLEA